MEDKLNELSLVNALIFGMLFAASYYVLFYHASNPETVIAGLDQNIVTLQGEISKLDRQIKEGEQLKQEIADMEAKAAKIYKYIPEEMSLEKGSSVISEEARLAGLSIQSIQTAQNWVDKKTVSVGVVDVRVEGKFSQIMIFLSEMTRKDQIYSIKQVKMNDSTNNKAELALDAKIEFFRRFEAVEK